MRTVFSGGRLFDSGTGQLVEADVAIDDARIVDVGTGLDGDQQVDCTGRSLLPGLIDAHVHVCLTRPDLFGVMQKPYSMMFYEAIGNLRATLAAGITHVRDAGGADLGVKLAQEQGIVAGPRLQIAIGMLSQTGGHGDGWLPSGSRIEILGGQHPGSPPTVVDGLDEMRKKVRELVRAGADVIKVATTGGVLSPSDDPRHSHFVPDELAVLVEEASAAGRWVMAHAQGAEGVKNAIRAGIRSIEHGIYLDDEAIELMLQHETYLVPTLIAPVGVRKAAEAGAQIPDAALRKAEEVIEIHRMSFRRAVQAGVAVAMGTDSGVTPHGENLDELPLMVEGGMSPAGALRSATAGAARLMGIEHDAGSIEPGKLADLVVVDGDPFEVAGLRDAIVEVWQSGRRVVSI